MEQAKQELSQKQTDYLAAFTDTGTVAESARVAGVHRRTIYKWEKSNRTNFAQAYADAKKDFADRLESVAYKRVFEQGANANPSLLMYMLRASNPQKYGTVTNETEESKDLLRSIKATATKERKVIDEHREVIPQEEFNKVDRLVKTAEKLVMSNDNR